MITPETDREIENRVGYGVSVEFARRLERERNKYRDALQKIWDTACSMEDADTIAAEALGIED